jgi:ATP-binding cassette ChvD family protein
MEDSGKKGCHFRALAPQKIRKQSAPARDNFGWLRYPLSLCSDIMAQYVYTMRRVGKVVPPKRVILEDISLSFFPGAKIGVLGLNGAGKSSLLRIMAGVDRDYIGEATPMPGLRVGYLPQEPQLDASKDVRGNVEEGVQNTLGLINRFNAISERFAEPLEDEEMSRLLEEQGELQTKIEAAGGWELDRKLEVAADALRLPPWDADVSRISGGERRRVALCRLLLSEPDMLLLDEPTNHLDALSVQWLEQFLERYPGTVIAVTHDRYFLDNVAGWILELDRGHGIPWQGNYSSWLEQKEKRLEIEARQESARIKAIQVELEWVRANPKARQAKSKARLARFEELASAEVQKRNEVNEIYIPPGPHLGNLVIEAEALAKSFGDRLLFDGLSFRLPPGGIVGVIGPNGAGKTTLFRILIGEERPDAGALRIGDTVVMAYVDQSRDALDPQKTVWEEISGGQDVIQVGNYASASRGYVARFNFKGADQQKRVSELSGGERNRLHLAKLLKSGGNVLLLDEPTNDLDVETLRALEQALLDFPGCAVVISHDRWFLDRVATHILAFEDDGRVVWFEGNYADYLEDRRRRLGAEADQPHRVRYRPLLA